jgi:class 3 adenylate cyclase
MAYQASKIRTIFVRYLDPNVVADLIENPKALKIGGDKQIVTILVSDLRGFTAISEKEDPHKVVAVINYYFEKMAEVITEYQGMIDEFLGDGILVLFGVPIAKKDDPVRAVACAIAMQQKLAEVNQYINTNYPEIPPLQMGIGINTGEVIVGNIGSDRRTKYGVVGNTINLTYRIESCTVGGQIFISETTKQETEKQNTSLIIAQTISKHFKGSSHPQNIYLITGIEGKYNLQLDTIIESLYPLASPIEIIYYTLEGKDINQEQNSAQLQELSANQAKLYSNADATLQPLTNIMFKFIISETHVFSDCIYAKVLRQEQQEIEIALTAVPPEVRTYLNNLYQQL